jgi:class 3 adenylate cyclase
LDNRLLAVFVKDYLGCIGEVVDKFRDRMLTVKTAGDGLFIVFRDLAGAVHFSLALRDATCAIDWAARGMPEDLGLRISLDAGPMLEFTDPITGRIDVAGRLVNRAARIEPITPVNHVYASRTLAALALAMEVPGVRFEYAGETPLPKGFGAFQLYHLTAA